MTTREFDGIRLEKVRDHVWEIPREGDMNVPARVLASDDLLEAIGEDDTLRQLKNATHLPGIAAPALCMPDGHQGYGFPVGGVGAVDARTGCISPGAVGYDINCLSGDAEVLLSHGRHRRIEDLSDRFEDRQARVADTDDVVDSDICLFTETTGRRVHELTTDTGDAIRATRDHPFETPAGMTDLGDVDVGDEVFVHPFAGLPDDDPPEFVVLDGDDFAEADSGLVRRLRNRDLLPLRSTDDAFHRLLKLVGYHTGHGSFDRGQTVFCGDPDDLETIRRDVAAIGLTPPQICERERRHDSEDTDTRPEHTARSDSVALKRLLTRLGAPDGGETDSPVTPPEYLARLADWQQALYLSAFFGAEMSAPDTAGSTTVRAPSVSHHRPAERAGAGEAFLTDLADLLDGLGVRTTALEAAEAAETTAEAAEITAGDAHRRRFDVAADPDNLIRFFTRIGYRYADEKQARGLLAAQYLKRVTRTVEPRAGAEPSRALADGGAEPRATDERGGRSRPPEAVPEFEEFCDRTTVRDDLAIAAEVVSISERAATTVYDIGVTNDAHTFVANGFVVSNCGVRMVRTNLTYDDVHGREEELVDALFEAIPSGLGGGGVITGTADAVEGALERGVEWAVEAGYGVEGDLTHCEDEGRRPDARPEYVSQKAMDRGRNQMGSLGSGNHFLEVQRVTDVYRPDVADAYGLSEEQIVVLIHCGSRGLGHQTCNDYLRRIEQEHADLLSSLPDKELAAAPAGSALAEEYYGAMGACINFAWVNRQLITHRAREVFGDVFGGDPVDDLGMELLYDVAHNIAKKERHEVGVGPDGRPAVGDAAVDREDRELYVHRKGATRAFPAGHEAVPAAYRSVGQPVIIPGSMGAGSYVLRGGAESMAASFGSTAHGAGRLMSRTQAKQEFWGGDVKDDLAAEQAIYVKAQSGATVAEEAPGVYKDVDEVVRVSDALGIGDTVARTFPVCNIKG
jgi:tRNA-splicing ligase RtcB